MCGEITKNNLLSVLTYFQKDKSSGPDERTVAFLLGFF
jgi:hypothetical protein